MLLEEAHKNQKSWGGALQEYAEGPHRDKWFTHSWAKSYGKDIRDIMAGYGNGTPLPAGAPAGGSSNTFVVKADPIDITLRDERGRPIAPQQKLTTRVDQARPFGT